MTKKIADFQEETVSHQDVKVRMKPGMVTERLNGPHYSRYPSFLTKGTQVVSSPGE